MLSATHSWGKGTCYEGEIQGYRVLAQVVDLASSDGIADGRIVQLHVGKSGLFDVRDSVLTYVREWFHSPPTGTLQMVVEQAVRQIDGKSIDWSAERRRFETGNASK